MTRTQEEWIEEYKKMQALWIYDDNPKRKHALLRSGNHSSGFFNSRPVISNEALLKDAASDLIELLSKSGEVEGFDIVIVGPQTGATKLAELLSKAIYPYTGEVCSWASPAKQEIDSKKSMVFSNEELLIINGQYIILCEDVLTTGGTIELAEKAGTEAGGIVLPIVLTLVNRSGFKEVNGKKIIALIDHPMPMWEPGDCPLCKQGSEAVRPKDNWDLLNMEIEE